MPTAEITFLEAIRQALQRLLRERSEVVLYGQDIGSFGGAFKVTAGLQKEFGAARVFDTPISESAILGSAIGMATQGLRPVVEMQFADFMMTAVHQLLNNASTLHYRTGIAAPMTVRAPCGGGFGGGPFHSEELETFFCHMPGIKVVYPAFPADARALLYSAVMDPNPVVYLENKYLYRHVKEWLPNDWMPTPLGVARVCRPGTDAVVLTYGAMVHEALRAAEQLAAEDVGEVMVLDLRTLKPLDTDAIVAAVAATNRVLIVHEGWHTSGFGAELAAVVAERAFHLLDAPVGRLTAPDCPIPFAPELEKAYRPDAEKIHKALVELLEY
ncbi:MAG: alpha-ketoacid dehydrogenase subunit beta [Verrucomicrobia bacterium]|nr:MAG: alpha-ketoacid dehydrogenase subunit beta [Verrucomicrobiota bacterium]